LTSEDVKLFTKEVDELKFILFTTLVREEEGLKGNKTLPGPE
jgi:hypothetical protein